MERTISQHIEITSGVCGGRPRVAEHRVRVQDIVVWHEREGFCPDEIVSRFPELTLADVYAALAYYWDHREQIDQDIRDDKEFAQATKMKTQSKLALKLARMDAGRDSVSS